MTLLLTLSSASSNKKTTLQSQSTNVAHIYTETEMLQSRKQVLYSCVCQNKRHCIYWNIVKLLMLSNTAPYKIDSKFHLGISLFLLAMAPV